MLSKNVKFYMLRLIEIYMIEYLQLRTLSLDTPGLEFL